MLFIAYVQKTGTQADACAGPLQAANPLPVADTVQRLSPQAARLFMPHPRRSCDSHMVSPPSLISEKSEDTWKERNLQSKKRRLYEGR